MASDLSRESRPQPWLKCVWTPRTIWLDADWTGAAAAGVGEGVGEGEGVGDGLGVGVLPIWTG